MKHQFSFWLCLSLLGLLLFLSSCSSPSFSPESLNLAIPAQSDWTDHGLIFDRGELGEWDYFLWGAFTGTAVKRNGTFYLYYQGARGYRTSFDETVTWRAIGMASSADGMNFSKSPSNPIITWFPNEEEEEGATSGAAELTDKGEIILFYGANTALDKTRVNADGRIALSADGVSFVDQGIALDHQDRSLWGSGDELFPIIAIHDGGRWFVYYLPNGRLQSRVLGVAWGSRPDKLTNSSAVRSGLKSVSAWGMGSAAQVGPDLYALFINEVTEQRLEVRLVSLDSPEQLSEPIQIYKFEAIHQGTVHLDEDGMTWFLYYRTEEGYGVMTAPVGEKDSTPP
jgi:hypothetical protein